MTLDKGDATKVLLEDKDVNYGTLEMVPLKDMNRHTSEHGHLKEGLVTHVKDVLDGRKHSLDYNDCLYCAGCREWAACCCEVGHEINRLCHSLDCKNTAKKCCSSKTVKRKLPILQWLPKYR